MKIQHKLCHDTRDLKPESSTEKASCNITALQETPLEDKITITNLKTAYYSRKHMLPHTQWTQFQTFATTTFQNSSTIQWQFFHLSKIAKDK